MLGWLSRLSVRLLISDQVMTSQFVRQSSSSGSALTARAYLGLSLSLFARLHFTHSKHLLSLKINKYFQKLFVFFTVFVKKTNNLYWLNESNNGSINHWHLSTKSKKYKEHKKTLFSSSPSMTIQTKVIIQINNKVPFSRMSLMKQ